jgi:shikimate kinase
MEAMSNLILIGPMGAGKTTQGKWLARHLGMDFIDLDSCIEQATGTDILHIFETEGEAGFRKRESEALNTVLCRDNIVLSTGGGTVLAEANRILLKQRGTVVYLHLPPEMQLQRLAGDRKRPLLQTPDRAERLQELSEIRTPIYRRCADITLDLSRIPMSQVRHRIMDAITEYRAEAQARHA